MKNCLALIHIFSSAGGQTVSPGVEPRSPTTITFAHRLLSVGRSRSPPTFRVKPTGHCRDRELLVSAVSTSAPARHSPLLPPWPRLLSLTPLPPLPAASSPLAQTQASASPGFPRYGGGRYSSSANTKQAIGFTFRRGMKGTATSDEDLCCYSNHDVSRRTATTP